MFERFTGSARQAIVRAQSEARQLGHGFIGCEHLLLGVLAADEPAAAVLREHDVTPERARAEVIRLVGAAPPSRPADLPLYPTTTPVGSLRGDPDLAAAAAVLGELPGPVRHSVASVTAPDPDQVTLRLADGITVVWGGTDRAGAKARELAILMRTHMHFYDVSAEGSVTAK